MVVKLCNDVRQSTAQSRWPWLALGTLPFWLTWARYCRAESAHSQLRLCWFSCWCRHLRSSVLHITSEIRKSLRVVAAIEERSRPSSLESRSSSISTFLRASALDHAAERSVVPLNSCLRREYHSSGPTKSTELRGAVNRVSRA